MSVQHSNDLNLALFFRDIWSAKLFLIVGFCVGVLAAFCFTVLAVPKVEARMMIAPAELMDVAMKTRVQNGRSDFVLDSGPMRQHEVVPHFTRFEAMIRGIAVSKILLRNDYFVDGVLRDRSFVFDERNDALNAFELAEYIRNHVRFDPFGESAMGEIVYRHSDGQFASYFVQQIHRVTDQLIRTELRDQVNERIAYLERVIAKTINPEQRRIMTSLLLEQERTRMLVSMDAPVAARIIDPVAVSSRAVWPNLAFIYSGFCLIGLILAYFIFGIVHHNSAVDSDHKPVRRGQDLNHQPKRPVKYGGWFDGKAGNDQPAQSSSFHVKRDARDAAE
ncbi:MAG: hypothetical protein AB8B83_09135 [Bdellovibrionales bacterium]